MLSIVLLHGYGSNELDLFSFADELPDNLLIISLRAPYEMGNGAYAWYAINLDSENNKFSDLVSILEYLPQSSTIWMEDSLHTIGILEQNFDKAIQEFRKKEDNTITHLSPEKIFTNGSEFSNQLDEFRVIEFGNNSIFNPKIKIKSDSEPLTVINKKFDLLFSDLLKNQKKNYKNIILCSSDQQEERFNQILENSKEEIIYSILVTSLREGFIDNDNKIAVYTDHQIFNRHHRFKSKTKFTDKQSITLKQLTTFKKGIMSPILTMV